MINLNDLNKELIVSCQAFPDEPLYGIETMLKLAKAAQLGGAKALRLNGPQTIEAIKKEVPLPIFGINKILPKDYNKKRDVIITPTLEAAKEIIDAGSDIIALDCTLRENRTKEDILSLIKSIKAISDVYIMGEVSTFEEGLIVEEAGCEIISTTISGYTEYSKEMMEPDFELIKELAQKTQCLINAEGRFHCPEDVIKAFDLGAWTVTVGSAITRPHFITKQYIEKIANYKRCVCKK